MIAFHSSRQCVCGADPLLNVNRFKSFLISAMRFTLPWQFSFDFQLK
jgi:hypothetical protein